MTGLATSKSPSRLARRGLSPFPEMLQLHDVLNSVLAGHPFWAEQTTTSWQPAVDIFEAADELVIAMDLPGVRKEDIQVNLNDSTLTIAGERHLENEDQRDRYHRVERTYGQFARSFTIPTNVNREALKAEYTDGVLRLHLPKREEAKPRQISIE